MNNIYIDCGANLGQGYEKMKNLIEHDSKIYMFEPLSNAYNYLKKTYPTFNIYNTAVWIENKYTVLEIETANIYNIPDVGHASNIIGEKYEFNKSSNIGWKKETVKLIDLIEFITTNFTKSDNIFIKFNIEGAEYEILDKIIETSTYEYIKTIKIDFHDHLRNDRQNLKPNDYYINFFKSKNIKVV